MPTFAVIAEGFTDQLVIESVVSSMLEGAGDEVDVNFIQPPQDETMAGGEPPAGGWTLVFRSLQRGDHLRALQTNDFLIVHVDTDVCAEPGFDVSRTRGDGELSPPDLRELVRRRLCEVMGDDFCATLGARVIFAVAIHTTECWLLPLLYATEKAKRSKTTGCIEAADWKLRRQKRPPLSRSTGEKDPRTYKALCRDWRKRRDIERLRHMNPSLSAFVDEIEDKALAPAGN